MASQRIFNFLNLWNGTEDECEGRDDNESQSSATEKQCDCAATSQFENGLLSPGK